MARVLLCQVADRAASIGEDLELMASWEDWTGYDGCARPPQRSRRSRREELELWDALDKEQYKKEQKIKKGNMKESKKKTASGNKNRSQPLIRGFLSKPKIVALTELNNEVSTVPKKTTKCSSVSQDATETSIVKPLVQPASFARLSSENFSRKTSNNVKDILTSRVEGICPIFGGSVKSKKIKENTHSKVKVKSMSKRKFEEVRLVFAKGNLKTPTNFIFIKYEGCKLRK